MLSTLFAQTDCVKCEIEKVKIVSENMDSLTFRMVADFFCTFDTSCSIDAEYSEWSNEILYNVLDRDPDLFLKVLQQEKVDDIQLVLNETENPIHEFDYQTIYDKVKNTKSKDELTIRVLKAIESAAAKEGIKMKN